MLGVFEIEGGGGGRHRDYASERERECETL